MSRDPRKNEAKALKLAQRAEQLVADGKFNEAIRQYAKAVTLMPEYADLLNNYANLLTSQNRFKDAISNYRQALRFDQSSAITYLNYANALGADGQISKALAACAEVQKIDPAFPGLLGMFGKWHAIQGQSDKALEFLEQALRLQPNEAWIRTLYLLTMHYTVDDPERIFAAHTQTAASLVATPAKSLTDRTVDRPLHIGYVSGDFRSHSVAFFIEPILQQHNRDRFSVYCYSTSSREDRVTDRLKSLADHWRCITGLSDNNAAKLIEDDQIDILIDLSGYTDGNRLGLFRHRPAGLQVTYLGYPATTGMDCFDYRITDAISDPVGDSENQYTEQLLRLEHGFLIYKPPGLELPPVKPTAMNADRPVTFGSFNNLAKLSDLTVDNWSAVLNGVSESRLLLKSHAFQDQATVDLTLQRFAGRGIDPNRLELRARADRPQDHLAMYRDMDIALDTFPYNGTTTTCEAMWMGVPVITLTGRTHKSRVSASILHQVGATELITDTADQFIAKAIELANSPKLVKDYKSQLREKVCSGSLTDASSFVRGFEDQLIATWRVHNNLS